MSTRNLGTGQILVAGTLSGTHLGKSKKRTLIATQLATTASRAGHPGSRRPASPWASRCHQQNKTSLNSHGLYVHESPCLAILCRVTSPVSWCPASRGAQQPCCPAAEAPGRFFVEINEGETWLQSPEQGWDRSQARTSAVPPRPRKM